LRYSRYIIRKKETRMLRCEGACSTHGWVEKYCAVYKENAHVSRPGLLLISSNIYVQCAYVPLTLIFPPPSSIPSDMSPDLKALLVDLKLSEHYGDLSVNGRIILKNPTFLDITLCSPLKLTSGCACYLLHTGSLLGLFDLEDGGDSFLRNVAYIPKDRTLHNN
jgi:hypothetical protein